MKCQICGSFKSRNDNGTKMCNQCNFPCIPKSQRTLEMNRKKWARRYDDIINGHKHGSWADQVDVAI